MLRDWSLITGRGVGRQRFSKREGQACEAMKMGGGVEKVLAMLKGGNKKFCGSFSHIEWGAHQVSTL